jgi:RND superfamily putative drug exporter
VAGFVLPVRAASVRSIVGFAELARVADPVREVAAVLAEKPLIVVIDGIDHVTDATARQAISDLLVSAGVAASQADRTFAIVVGTASVTLVDDVIPGVDSAEIVSLATDYDTGLDDPDQLDADPGQIDADPDLDTEETTA